MMPKLDGVEACYKLRSMPQFKNTLIAFLSARGEDYSQVAGLDAGADDYITKPFNSEELLYRIQAILKRSQQKADPREEIKEFNLKDVT